MKKAQGLPNGGEAGTRSLRLEGTSLRLEGGLVCSRWCMPGCSAACQSAEPLALSRAQLFSRVLGNDNRLRYGRVSLLVAGAKMVATAPCSVTGCNKNGRNGKAAKGKYCDEHIPEGIAAGSITSKRGRPTSPAGSSSSTQVSSVVPEGWKMLEIKMVFGSRCAPAPRCCLPTHAHPAFGCLPPRMLTHVVCAATRQAL